MIIKPLIRGNVFPALPADAHAPTPLAYTSLYTSGYTRRGFLTASIAGLGLLSACTRKGILAKDVIESGTRARRKTLLEQYLRNQTVADARKVDNYFIREEVLDNPTLLGVCNRPEYIEALRKNKDNPLTIYNYKYVVDRSGKNTTVRIERTPLNLVIPGKLLDLTLGTQSERNSFDTLFYHEVEGHGTDRAHGSLMNQTEAAIYPLLGYNTDNMMDNAVIWTTMLEFSAHLKELNRSIEVLNLLEDPNAVEPWIRKNTDDLLTLFTIRLLNLTDETSPSWKKQDENMKKIKLHIKRFCSIRFRSVLPRTRAHVLKLVRQKGWKKSIPW